MARSLGPASRGGILGPPDLRRQPAESGLQASEYGVGSFACCPDQGVQIQVVERFAIGVDDRQSWRSTKGEIRSLGAAMAAHIAQFEADGRLGIDKRHLPEQDP